jgi:uncharacterized protein YdeI (YjbR/CyaY-like superfamily)
MADDYPILLFETPPQWRTWLEKNHASQNGVWLKFAKKNTGVTSVNYAESLDEALCFGWIDGQVKAFDEIFYLQKFTPRRKRSVWSANNVKNIERLIKEKKMTPAGMKEVEAAKADGRWDAAYAPQGTAAVPDDLAAALKKSPKAEAFFKTLTGSNRYSAIFRTVTAKKPETRARRIAKIVEMMERGEKFY